MAYCSKKRIVLGDGGKLYMRAETKTKIQKKKRILRDTTKHYKSVKKEKTVRKKKGN